MYQCSVSVSTKRAVYCSVVLLVLLYGAETWTIKRFLYEVAEFLSQSVHKNYTRGDKIQTVER